jgi:hypothetical protein
MNDNKLNIFDRVRLWWKFDGRFYPKYFIYGVKNLIKWLPTIWKDRDWDDYFIFEIIRVKLENQAKYIGGKNRHLGAKKDAERMRLVSRLIKKQQEEYYLLEYLDYETRKIEFTPTEDGKWYNMEDTLITERFDDYFKLYPLQHKKVLSGEINWFKTPIEEKSKHLIAMEIAHENQERCKKLIFKLMTKYISRWWD